MMLRIINKFLQYVEIKYGGTWVELVWGNVGKKKVWGNDILKRLFLGISHAIHHVT